MELKSCYIDSGLCTGARFSFCNDCQKAQEENADEIRRAQTPIEVTLAHISKQPKNK